MNCSCSRASGTDATILTVIEEFVGKGHIFFYEQDRKPLFITICAIGIVILVATVLCLMCLNHANKNSITIERNIAASVFIFELTYLITILMNEQLVDNHFTLCKTVTLILHFSSVSMFSWSFISSFHIYRMLTELRDINQGTMTFYTALGFGIPAIVVILTVGVSGHNYGGTEICWLSYTSASIWGMIAPEIICISFSIFFTLINIRTVFSVKTDLIDDLSMLRLLFFINIGTIPLLIAVQVAAVLYINEVTDTLLYVYLSVALITAVYLCIGFVVCDKSLFRFAAASRRCLLYTSPSPRD